jgi:pimeloyl-ACP methyl ester carboxylesterase
VRASEGRRPGLVAAIVVGVALVAFSSPAGAAEVSWMRGFDDPATPNSLDRVGVLKVGPERAKNVLVLNPGTSAGAAYFRPLAEDVVSKTDGRWQVWSVERRENQLEDHSLLDASKLGTASPQEVFDYYLGWLVDPSVTTHFELVPDSSVAFARGWGMNVEVEDLRRVVEAARAGGRRVVLGGHSLGGSITTAYATWDFKGRPAARDVSGLVYIDGASNPTPIPPEEAGQSLQELQNDSPWLAFGGIPAPFLGIFSATGSTATVVAPDAPSLGWSFPLLPANLKPPMQPTNEGQFGYAVDTDTSPPSLAAAHVRAGRLAASGSPRGWDRAGEITPIQRYADMLSGTGLTGMDGSAWYHPMRLTLDSRAVANGNANPAQSVLGVKAIHGDDLSKHTPIYAFGARGGEGVLESARLLSRQSDIRDDLLTLVNRQATYSHNDPSAASPQNEFVDQLIPFLAEIGKR